MVILHRVPGKQSLSITSAEREHSNRRQRPVHGLLLRSKLLLQAVQHRQDPPYCAITAHHKHAKTCQKGAHTSERSSKVQTSHSLQERHRSLRQGLSTKTMPKGVLNWGPTWDVSEQAQGCFWLLLGQLNYLWKQKHFCSAHADSHIAES